ncbi:syntaxin-binding protein 5-like isoform X1 [Rhincodon typus]|uniref:syntaxin-binding protein 5-like isoform X1 n=1 Tax=Rhincodon typus TaxID=259920 RepID=UPI00202FA119|nr:syntaxin-binding protein 5-like isoform X1 [Rhincodon typus]
MMKKFNFRRVLDGLTAASSPAHSGGGLGSGTGAGGGSSTGAVSGGSSAASGGGGGGAMGGGRGGAGDSEIPETLTSEHFQICKTVRHGFPCQPSALAFDPVQKILAIGCRTGALRILGRPGVDCYCQHDSGAAVLQLQFLINEGALVSACADDTLHLWNLRQKRPAVLHSLKFNRERITCCHLPFQSKWLYVGTERGNTYVVNIESFVLSGYVIMWNKAIELSTKTHPGPVVHLSDSPRDEGKLLMGFESGTVVLWDIRSKRADFRFYYDEAIHSVSWHHEGRQFMCSHSDGSLTLWNLKNPSKPFQIIVPHGKVQRDGKKPEPCKPILKVDHKTCRYSEPFIIFSGGLSYDKVCRRPSLTIMHGKSITVLEMDYPIVDFLALCETPYPNEFQEPYAVVVLLEKDLIVVDLTQSNFPIFENPYPMDVHESPVTCCAYFADCPPDLIPALYSVGAKQQKKQGYSTKEWPIAGGTWNLGAQSYPEIIITGHADGSLKFWDASAITLQVLYKLKTSKVFEKQKMKDAKQIAEIVEEDPYAIQMISWCPESRMFCVAGISAHVIVYRFSKHEITVEIVALELRLQYEVEDIVTPEPESVQPITDNSSQLSFSKTSALSSSANALTSEGLKDNVPCLKVKTRPVKMAPGYQADLVIQMVWIDGEPPQQITSLAVSSAYGLVAFGNCNGLAIVDFMQKTTLLSMGTIELYGTNDPFQRHLKSPRKSKQLNAETCCMRGLSSLYSLKRLRASYQSLTELLDNPVSLEIERCKSPTSDHVNGVCTSPISQPCNTGKRLSIADTSKLNRRGPGRPPFRKAQSAACMEISLPVTHTEESKENSFNRSRSSSVSSIDKESKEAITALYFMESYSQKMDSTLSPCLWVGTSLGTVLVISLNLPSEEQRYSEPLMVSPSGTVLMLKGSLLTFSFLDSLGGLIHPPYEVWKDPNNEDKDDKGRKRKLVTFSPSSPQDIGDHQYVVLCSEKQAKVYSLPSQSCLYIHNITETSFVLRADVITMCNSICLACFCANGHIMTLSLPSLRPLLDVNYLPLTDMRIARTFCFTNGGQALYLSSPTEIQRITYSQEMCENLQEMLGDLFTPIETPEAQNRGFLKGLFGGSGQTFDREELFGEASAGKASRTLAQHIPGPGGLEGVKGAASGVVGDLARARIALDERGQRLGELEDRTAAMMASAETFSKHAHELMLKCRDKKWYQF